jgi:DNA-directed RNA polymerase subunit omega
MAETTDTMMNPGVEELLDRTGSKFSLVAVASRRARGINTYYSQLGEALSHGVVPPQVTSTAHKPLSIAFEEIAADKIEGVGGATGRPLPEALLPKPEPDLESVLGLDPAAEPGTDDG